ncbi:Histone-lysine N-methyltransferase, H3 lysine-79 specific [Fulvia fulva]|uniref:Histone-lysine N-methyltransferase, H3 lysine-79 specific n=1 Tax=Passalora fulva TaxID=5499 RepID=A0A9Q8LHC4_PASFU|nr:Histone-lysine N-methyltransferase, H3 lysine-79 specific [Fulvia fulva]KAK4624168.1 Histone-lysine N-methyltransferase, H3 lysine-79 specific [Fulvia fulva]KAK4625134.1 Histone-lysine N-methyltransferase, H3 lysine-79 specific [Fulvia fulva]UJO17495.1 Histone-lysine N-methyltransferase, H3 lysine-79 specific [Fulvia fulva]WPV15219.1 Histone-lysine N-methyltransferase, H3 lysine-79 specific [Fulvia fulva]WPV30326.1 Histone-lysine N-methyltransferase, H3 lysine-79 specific [Fulvia fulva]
MQNTHKRKRKQARSPSGRFRPTVHEKQLVESGLDVDKPCNATTEQLPARNDAGTKTPTSFNPKASAGTTTNCREPSSEDQQQRKLVPVVQRVTTRLLSQYRTTTELKDEPPHKLVPVITRVTPETLAQYPKIPESPRLDSTPMTAAELLASPARHLDEPFPDALAPLQFALHQVPVSWINMLHHSASNTSTPSPGNRTGSPWSGELRYPSGFSERFVLTRNKSRPSRSKQGNLGLQPIDDLLRTIEVILRLVTGKADAPVDICVELENAWKQGKRSLFEKKLGAANGLIASPLRITRPSSAMIHHFLEQLYDRAVSPFVDNLNRNMKSREGAYGEMQPAFVSKIFRQLGVNKNSVYLDLGCGVGNTVMQAALETGCEAHGIEREAYPHLVGSYHLQQFQIRSMLWGMRPGKVQLYNGDFLQSPTIDALLPDVDLVLANNFMFGPETDTGIALYGKLLHSLKTGAQVVSLHPLAIAKLRKVGGSNSTPCLAFETEELIYEEGSVSWSGKAGTYYVSTKL